jgi:hypothetical protein
MKMPVNPSTKLGKCSVGLQIGFLAILFVPLFLVLGLKVLSFDNAPTFSFMGETSLTWWDPTVGILSIVGLAAFISGIGALIKKDRSLLVFISVGIGICALLFVLLHSLFISD